MNPEQTNNQHNNNKQIEKHNQINIVVKSAYYYE